MKLVYLLFSFLLVHFGVDALQLGLRGKKRKKNNAKSKRRGPAKKAKKAKKQEITSDLSRILSEAEGLYDVSSDDETFPGEIFFDPEAHAERNFKFGDNGGFLDMMYKVDRFEEQRSLLTARGSNMLGVIVPEDGHSSNGKSGRVVKGGEPTAYVAGIRDIVQRTVARNFGMVVMWDFYNTIGGFSAKKNHRVDRLAEILCHDYEIPSPICSERSARVVPYNHCLFVTAVYEAQVKDVLALYATLPLAFRLNFYSFLLRRNEKDNDDFYLNLPAPQDIKNCDVPVYPNVVNSPYKGDQYRDWKDSTGFTKKSVRFWKKEFPGRPFPFRKISRNYWTEATQEKHEQPPVISRQVSQKRISMGPIVPQATTRGRSALNLARLTRRLLIK